MRHALPSGPVGQNTRMFGLSWHLRQMFIWMSPLATQISPLLTSGVSLPVEADGPRLLACNFFR